MDEVLCNLVLVTSGASSLNAHTIYSESTSDRPTVRIVNCEARSRNERRVYSFAHAFRNLLCLLFSSCLSVKTSTVDSCILCGWLTVTFDRLEVLNGRIPLNQPSVESRLNWLGRLSMTHGQSDKQT